MTHRAVMDAMQDAIGAAVEHEMAAEAVRLDGVMAEAWALTSPGVRHRLQVARQDGWAATAACGVPNRDRGA